MPDLSPVVLLVYANDRLNPERYLRDLVEEVRAIRQRLYAQVVPPYQVVERGNATLDDLIQALDQYAGRVRVLHIAGHADSLELMLEGPGGGPGRAGREGLARLLGAQVGLRLVFLNGCATQAHAEALVAAGVPAVIATDRAISDQAAARFAGRFYERLAQRDSVGRAFAAAEVATQTALMTGADYRSLYWPGEEVPATFPWALYGPGGGWQLRLPRPGHQGPHTYLMCDRDRQVEVFRDALERLMGRPERQPLFFVVHGEEDERHRSLVARLREVEIREQAERSLGQEMGYVQFFEVREWPSTGDLALRQRNLLRSLAKALDLPAEAAPGEAPLSWLARQGRRSGVLVLQHTLLAAKWDKTALALVRWYLQDFWVGGHAADLPQFIIFLNLIYPPESPGWLDRLFGRANPHQRILRQLIDLEASAGDRLTLLRKLEPITYADVVEWVEEYYPDELDGLAGILFADPARRPLPMRQVETRLREEVQRLHQAQARRDLLGQ